MIFHHPLPLYKNAKSASGIRPLRMIEAFEKLGYEVFKVIGYGEVRKDNIRIIKKRILLGDKFDFIYSESSTQPTLLTEKNHLPRFPFIDFNFFSFCKSYGIKIGLFYRDIYWLFPEYGNNTSFKKKIAQLFYRYDLIKYNKLVDKIYLPSMEMSKYIPFINQDHCMALPPGHDECEPKEINLSRDILKLLYVGGLGNHYQMHLLFDVLKDLSNIHFTLCTRKSEWMKIKSQYSLSSNISYVHEYGDGLEKLYFEADIAMLFVKPQSYREFAVPMKLFEYIGKSKPVIASNGTLAGNFVVKNDIGWSIEYTGEKLKDCLLNLLANRSLINQKKINIDNMKSDHTWESRALRVQKNLT